jgi:hypothetical protein
MPPGGRLRKDREALLAYFDFPAEHWHFKTNKRHAQAGWSVAFASELRALLTSGLLGTPHLNPQGMASNVWNGFVVGPGTAVKGVDLLWPGRLLELDGAGKEVRQEDFWRIADRWTRKAWPSSWRRAEAPPRERRAPSRSSSPAAWTRRFARRITAQHDLLAGAAGAAGGPGPLQRPRPAWRIRSGAAAECEQVMPLTCMMRWAGTTSRWLT